MSVLSKDADLAVRWSSAERVRALKQIVPRKAITNALRPSEGKHRHCRRLPRWFMVWFLIALGLFNRRGSSQGNRFWRLVAGEAVLVEVSVSPRMAVVRNLPRLHGGNRHGFSC
jgi:Insertion element 4 transposase N-terminal